MTPLPCSYRLILASPQRAENPSKFEEGMLLHPNLDEYSPYKHHKDSYAFQVQFHAHAKSLVEVLRPVNPYKDYSPHLSTWHTKLNMTDVVVNCIRELRSIGNELYKDYAETRFMDGSKDITDTIHRNKLLTFMKPPDKPKQDYESLKQNTALVLQLFLSTQSRCDADLMKSK